MLKKPVSLWLMIDFENPMARALKLKKVSKRTSQSCRNMPRAEANQLIVLFSRSYLQRDIRNHYRTAKWKLATLA